MSITSSDLDFNKIKTKLKTYLERQDEFSDYNFEASGLSNILDVLAYNTHINGLTANMAINESFLSTAQLRSSVLQHAEGLGYYPKSASASTAILEATVNIPSGPGSLVLPANTEFNAEVDEVNYTFLSTESVVASNVNDTFTFKVQAKQGRRKIKTFVVGDTSDDQVFVIPDENMDTETVVVKVFENFTTAEYTPYTNVNKAITVKEDSTVYMLREATNGYYELFFGDGNVLGRAPISGNKVRVEYISTIGAPANGASDFEAGFVNYNGSDYTINVTTISPAAGGSAKESLESIKKNAPMMHATQRRLVTAEDYETLIGTSYAAVIDDVVAWGGQDNIPPKFGTVFVGLNFKDGLSEQVISATKNSIIKDLTSNISIMSIDTEFVDPLKTYLELNTYFNVDTKKTGLNYQELQVEVSNLIKGYVDLNLKAFNSTFRRSNLLTLIDNLSPAILNSRMDVKIQQRLSKEDILVNYDKDYTIKFPVILGAPDKDHHTLTTSVFKYKGQNVLIKNELGSNRLQIFDLNNSVKLLNAGEYDPATGVVYFRALNIEQPTTLKVSVIPANQSTVQPLRNYIIDIDTAYSSVNGNVELGINKAVL